MKKVLQNISRNDLVIFFCMLLISSLFWSEFLITIAMIGLAASAVFKSDLANTWRRFTANRAYLVITILFFIVLISGLYSENMDYWLERLRIKLPFLVLPFVFAGIGHINERTYHALFYFMVVLATMFSIGVGINYALNFEEINLAIKQSRAMPTPTNHIRFSLLLALSILAGGLLFLRKFYWKYPWERWLIFGCTFVLFFFIHILSVRSGLFALYCAAFFLVLRYIWMSGRVIFGVGILIAMVSIPILAYQYIHSFRTKIDLIVWNYKMYKEGNVQDYSDTRRIYSYAVGLDVAADSPLIGVGAGDIKTEVYKNYEKNLQSFQPMLPHNQYLFVYVSTGIIGLVLFLGAVFYPLFYKRHYEDGLFVAFHLIVFLSFMVENTIENAVGVAFYIFFLLLGLNYLDGKRDQSTKENGMVSE
ncbi:MAG: O-antigen ligase family protein [Bacteroidota bacterium]